MPSVILAKPRAAAHVKSEGFTQTNSFGNLPVAEGIVDNVSVPDATRSVFVDTVDKPRAAGARVVCVACGTHAKREGGKLYKCARCVNHSFAGVRSQ